MTERTYSQHDRHILLLTNLQELPEVLVAAPVPLTFCCLMMNPEAVCGDDGDTTGTHLLYLTLPFGSRHTREVYLAHDRQNMLATNDETA